MNKTLLTKRELGGYKTVDIYVLNGDIICSDVSIHGYKLVTTCDKYPVSTENKLLSEGEFIIDGDQYITIVSGAVVSLTQEEFDKIYGIN